MPDGTTGSLDPGAVGPLDPAYQNISLGPSARPSTQSGTTSAKVQTLSISPTDYYYLSQLSPEASARIKSGAAYEAKQEAAIATKMEPVYRQINVLEQKLALEKENLDKKLSEHRREYDEQKRAAQEESKKEYQVRSVSLWTNVTGYDKYKEDVNKELTLIDQYKEDLKTAQKEQNLTKAETIMKKIDERTQQLDKLLKIDPFSKEGQKKYPSVISGMVYPTDIVGMKKLAEEARVKGITVEKAAEVSQKREVEGGVTARAEAILAAQKAADIATSMAPMYQQISVLESQIDAGKALQTEHFNTNRALYDSLATEKAKLEESQKDVVYGAKTVMTIGYDRYKNDIEIELSNIRSYKKDLTKAQADNDLDKANYIMGQIKTSADKLDKLYKLDPFSKEGQKLYPLKSERVDFKTEYIPQGPGASTTIAGPGGVTVIPGSYATGTTITDSSGKVIGTVISGSTPQAAIDAYHDAKGNYIGPGSATYLSLSQEQRDQMEANRMGVTVGSAVPQVTAQQAQNARDDASRLKLAYDKILQDPNASKEAKDAAYDAARNAAMRANNLTQITTVGTVITSSRAVIDAINKIEANPYDPTITESDRLAYSINKKLSDPTVSYSDTEITKMAGQLVSKFGQDATITYLQTVTPGQGSAAFQEAKGVSATPIGTILELTTTGVKKVVSPTALKLDIITPETDILKVPKPFKSTSLPISQVKGVETNIVDLSKKALTPELTMTNIAEGMSLPQGPALEAMKIKPSETKFTEFDLSKITSGISAAGGGLIGFGERFVTMLTKPEYAPIWGIGALPGGGAAPSTEIVTKAPSVIETIISTFGKKPITPVAASVVPIIGVTGTLTKPSTPTTPSALDLSKLKFEVIGKGTEAITGATPKQIAKVIETTPVVTGEISAATGGITRPVLTAPPIDYSKYITGIEGKFVKGEIISPTPDRFVTAKIPIIDILPVATRDLNKPFNFNTITSKNVNQVNDILDTMNGYTKTGKPLTADQGKILNTKLLNANIGINDKMQIASYINNYQEFTLENEKAAYYMNKIGAGDTSSTTVNAAASAIENISKYDTKIAQQYKSDVSDMITIQGLVQLGNAPSASKDWNKTIAYGKTIVSNIQNPDLKKQYENYIPNIKKYYEVSNEPSEVATSNVPLTKDEQNTKFNAYVQNIGDLRRAGIITADQGDRLIRDYGSALTVPEITSEINTMIKQAPEKGITNIQLADLENKMSNNTYFTKTYTVSDPFSRETRVSSYKDDVLKDIRNVQSGYMTPEQFEVTNSLGFLTTFRTKEEPSGMDKFIKFVAPGLGYGGDVLAGMGYLGYDIYKGTSELLGGARVAAGGLPYIPSTTAEERAAKPLPTLTKETGTIGYSLERAEAKVTPYFDIPLYTDVRGMGVSTKDIAEVGAMATMGLVTLPDKTKEEMVLKPLSKQLNAPIIYEGPKFTTQLVREVGEEIIRSPVEKPVEFTIMAGVGYGFGKAIPMVESKFARILGGTIEKPGLFPLTVSKGASLTQRMFTGENIAKATIGLGLGAPYAISAGERIVTSDRPGITLGRIIGGELIPMGIGSKLATPKAASEVTPTRTPTPSGGGRLENIIGSVREAVTGRGRVVPDTYAKEAAYKSLEKSGKYEPSQPTSASMREAERLAGYLEDYQKSIIKEAKDSGRFVTTTDLKNAVDVELQRLNKKNSIEREDILKSYEESRQKEIERKSMEEQAQRIPMPESQRGLEQMGVTTKAEKFTPEQQQEFRNQELLAEYLAEYQKSIIKEAKDSGKFVTTTDLRHATEVELQAFNKKSSIERNDFLKSYSEVKQSAKEAMVKKSVSSNPKVKEIIQEKLTPAQQQEFRNQELLSEYLADYQKAIIKEAKDSGKFVTTKDLQNATEIELQSFNKKNRIEQLDFLKSYSESKQAARESIIKKEISKQPKVSGIDVEKLTPAQQQEFRNQELLSEYLADYQKAIIKEAKDSGKFITTKDLQQATEIELQSFNKKNRIEQLDFLKSYSESKQAVREDIIRSEIKKQPVIKGLETKEFTPAQQQEFRNQELLSEYLADYQKAIIKEAKDSGKFITTKDLQQATEIELQAFDKKNRIEQLDFLKSYSESKQAAREAIVKKEIVKQPFIKGIEAEKISHAQRQDMRNQQLLSDYLADYQKEVIKKAKESGKFVTSADIRQATEIELQTFNKLNRIEQLDFLKSYETSRESKGALPQLEPVAEGSVFKLTPVTEKTKPSPKVSKPSPVVPSGQSLRALGDRALGGGISDFGYPGMSGPSGLGIKLKSLSETIREEVSGRKEVKPSMKEKVKGIFKGITTIKKPSGIITRKIEKPTKKIETPVIEEPEPSIVMEEKIPEPVIEGSDRPGFRHSRSPARSDYDKYGGWKLHLSVKPENYKSVDAWLDKNHDGLYKLLSGGEPGEKDFTIYIGDRSKANILANRMTQEIGNLLESGKPAESTGDLLFTDKVAGRFDISQATIEKYKGKPGEVDSSYRWQDSDAIRGLPVDQLYAEYRYQRNIARQLHDVEGEQHYRKLLSEREREIEQDLINIFGERFTGEGRSGQAQQTVLEKPKVEESIRTETIELPSVTQKSIEIITGKLETKPVLTISTDLLRSALKAKTEPVIKPAVETTASVRQDFKQAYNNYKEKITKELTDRYQREKKGLFNHPNIQAKLQREIESSMATFSQSYRNSKMREAHITQKDLPSLTDIELARLGFSDAEILSIKKGLTGIQPTKISENKKARIEAEKKKEEGATGGTIKTGGSALRILSKVEQVSKLEEPKLEPKVEQKAEQKAEQKVEQKPESKKEEAVTSPLLLRRRLSEGILSPYYEHTFTKEEVEARQGLKVGTAQMVSEAEAVAVKPRQELGFDRISATLEVAGVKSRLESLTKPVQEVKQELTVSPKQKQKQKLTQEVKQKQETKTRFATLLAVSPKQAVETESKFMQMPRFDQLSRTLQVTKQVPSQETRQKTKQVTEEVQKQVTKEVQIEVPKPKKPKLKLLPPVGTPEPWGYSTPFGERLGRRKIFQPIATGTQLLTGKGLFDIKYNIKTPSGASAPRAGGIGITEGTSKTIKGVSPIESTTPVKKLSDEEIRAQMMAMAAKSKVTRRPTIGEGTTIGSNIGKVVKGIANPTLRKSKKKSNKTSRIKKITL